VSTTVQGCGQQDPNDPCKDLRDKISRKVFQTKTETGIRGLRQRILDQINEAHGPGTKEWSGHDIQIEQVKTEIKKLIKKFNDNDCGDKTPLGSNLKEWVNKPAPTPAE
jgi:hypothetical protein